MGSRGGALQYAASVATAPADGLAAKKKSLRAQEQDTPENRERREAWQEQVKQVDSRLWVFVDESGATTEMTRRYGRAPRGERVREATPAGHWSTLTLLGAMSTEGLLATMTVESPTDGDVFLAYLEQVLCPRLQPGTQHLFQVSQKDIPVGGRLHGHGGQQPLRAHRSQQGQCAPVASGRSFPDSFPARRATVAPGHLRGRAALIHKHPQPGIDRLYLLLPCLAALPVFRRVLLLRTERL